MKDYFLIDLVDSLGTARPDSLHLVVRSVEEPYFRVENVFGFVKGTQQPDSFILFTAHYDHLGMMGNHAMFPGAHDNASGTAMIMDLARHFAAARPGYSIGFLACAAEESGLHGSFYFADHPLIPLENIRFVVNLDLIGSGSEGIRVVNGEVHTNEFAILERLHQEEGLLQAVKARGSSANSDHYAFQRKGIPAFFIYTSGKEYTEYHTLADRAEGLPLTAYEDLFRLLLRYADTLMQDEP